MKELLTFTDDPLALAALADWLEERGDARAGEVRRVKSGDVRPYDSFDGVRYFFTYSHCDPPTNPWNLTREMAKKMETAGRVTVKRNVQELDMFYFPSRADAIVGYLHCLLS